MSGQVIGDTTGQTRGANFGVLGVNDVNNLVLEDKYSQQPGVVYLGTHDYTGSTFASGINIPTVANSGYLDPSTYRTHILLISQIRQSGPHLMNSVFTVRNASNSAGISSPTYGSYANETLQDNSDNNTLNLHANGNYMRMMNTKLKDEDDAQMCQLLYLFNIGQNTQQLNVYVRMALRSTSYSGRHNSYEGGGGSNSRTDLGAFRWSGYTTSTWNARFDIYGVRV